MPYTGFDPLSPGGINDASGGGLDPSYYTMLAPGGRFPGDSENFLEYLAALSRGTAGGNPDYDLPDWLTNLGRFGRLLGAHERNAQQGGPGQSPDLPGGYPYHFFSGPGTAYGPPGGPYHGLVDQDRDGIWDTPEYRPPGVSGLGDGGRKKGGGGGGGGLQFTPYQQGPGMQGGGFVDWQPIAPFSQSSEPTRFVPGGGLQQSPSQQPTVPGQTQKPPAQPTGRWRGPNKGGKPSRVSPSPGSGGPVPGLPGQPGGAVLDLLRGIASPIGPQARAATEGGVNVNNLDMGTPGWMRDPTAGTRNTAGFPLPTPWAPEQEQYQQLFRDQGGIWRPASVTSSQTFEDYLTQLHDMGMDSESIGSLLGPYGFRQDDSGGWSWAWGTGPVVRTDEGYQFARQAVGNNAGGGGTRITEPWNAADALQQGVFGNPFLV